MKKKSLIALSSIIGVGLTSLGLFAARAKNQADNLLDTLSPASPRDKQLLILNNSIAHQLQCLKTVELYLARIHDKNSAEQCSKPLARLVSSCENSNFTMHYELVCLKPHDRELIEKSYMQQIEPLRLRIDKQVRSLFGDKLCYNSRALGKAVFPLIR